MAKLIEISIGSEKPDSLAKGVLGSLQILVVVHSGNSPSRPSLNIHAVEKGANSHFHD